MFFYSAQEVDLRYEFSASVTGTPTAQLYVDGSASGSAVDGTGSGTDWTFSITMPTLTAGQWVEAFADATISGVSVTPRLIAGSAVAAAATVNANVTQVAGQTASASATVDFDDVASILADTDELQSDDIPGAISGLNNISTGDVNTQVAAALATYDPPTNAELSAAQSAIISQGDSAWATATGFSTLDAAGIRTAIGLASANLDTQIGTLATAAALATVDGVVDSILVDTGTTLPATLGTPIDTDIATDIANIEAGGGGDAKEAKQDAMIANLVTLISRTADGVTVSVVSPSTSNGEYLPLVKGDDYSESGDDADPIVVDVLLGSINYGESDIASAEFRVDDEQSGETLFTVPTGSITIAETTNEASESVLRFTITATAANTATLRRGNNTAKGYVVATLNDDNVKTPAVIDIDVT